MVMEVGRVCVKIAGRDAGKKCVILQVIDKNFVLIDGQTRRKRANMLHLEPLAEVLDIKENASESEVEKAFKSLGVEIVRTKKKTPGPAKASQPTEPTGKKKTSSSAKSADKKKTIKSAAPKKKKKEE